MTIWKIGPPPAIGWWNASRQRNEDMWRWWNGETWSVVVHDDYEPEEAGAVALVVDSWQGDPIEWTWYWPHLARVKRGVEP